MSRTSMCRDKIFSSIISLTLIKLMLTMTKNPSSLRNQKRPSQSPSHPAVPGQDRNLKKKRKRRRKKKSPNSEETIKRNRRTDKL